MKDEKSVSEIYESIGGNILDSIKTDQWLKAVLTAKFIDKSVGFSLEVIDDQSSMSIKLQNGFNCMKDIKELHKITTQESENKWNKAVFTILPNNKFNIDFIWDQEIVDGLEKM